MKQPTLLRRVATAALCALMAGPAAADFIPSHGAVAHLDPFAAGWSPPIGPVPPAPAPGTVVGAPVGGPFTNDIIGSLAIDTKIGFDGLVSPSGWHWEIELDLDPYPGLLPGGVIPPVFFSLFGGPLVGPFLVAPFPGGGPDIYIDVHQPDFPAETGAFAKHLINLLPVPVGWGTSVTEDPAGGDAGLFGKNICPGREQQECEFIEEPEFSVSKVNALALLPIFDLDPTGQQIWAGIVIEQRHIPEPATLVLLAVAMTGIGWSRIMRA